MIRRPVELPLAAWPEADRIAWSDLFRKGDLLDGQGAAVHWAEATRRTNCKHYARWLGWLAANDLMQLNLAPWERVSPARVDAYVPRQAGPACTSADSNRAARRVSWS
jgi:hypothetical protein